MAATHNLQVQKNSHDTCAWCSIIVNIVRLVYILANIYDVTVFAVRLKLLVDKR